MKTIFEISIFAFIMIIFSFITSYLTDILMCRKIIYIPKHSISMISGITSTSILVYILFIDAFKKYTCSNS